MPFTEVSNMREGSLSWVSASGNSNSWATGASSPSGTAVAFVRTFDYSSGQTINTVMNRGVPNHHKLVSQQPPTINLSYAYTGAVGVPDYPVHLEIKWTQGDNSAFHQIHHARRTNQQFSENENENAFSDSFVALGYIEATASGYLGH